MFRPHVRWLCLAACGFVLASAPSADAACCYFSAKEKDILQPAQKVFISFDPEEKVESFTVQPKFEGNALDFGMVIPTPSKPKLDEMPRDFFKELAIYSILKKREQPQSKLLPVMRGWAMGGGFGGGGFGAPAPAAGPGFGGPPPRPKVVVIETGVVGSLDYKIITAERADDLFTWLKENNYSYAGDEATLDFYIKKKWLFTVMKIDTMQMKKNPDGSFAGEVTPTRFQFTSDKLIYPLKITQLSVKEKTEALFYVQAPYKTDLPGDFTYQYQWVPMIQNAQGWYAKGIFGTNDLPGKADDWLKSIQQDVPQLLQKGQALGFNFVSGQRPQPNKDGRIATTLEWARKLTAEDIKILKGQAPYSEKVPDPDEGFTQADVQGLADFGFPPPPGGFAPGGFGAPVPALPGPGGFAPAFQGGFGGAGLQPGGPGFAAPPQADAAKAKRAQAVINVIQQRLAKCQKERPGGYLVREAPEKDIKELKILVGHLKEGQFVTKFRKTFTKSEMNDDLLIVEAKLGKAVDRSEYEEILPTSPP